MRYAFDIPAHSIDAKSVSGDFVVCDKANGPLTVRVRRKENGQAFSYDIEPGEQVRLPWEFDSVEVQDRSGAANAAVLLLGFGEFRQRGDGQSVTIIEIIKPVDVQRIIDTVTAQITGTVQAQITNQIAAAIVGNVGVEQAGPWSSTVSGIVSVDNQVNIRPLTETVKTSAQGITETRETAASSLAQASHTFTAAAEVYNVTANANRRDLRLIAAKNNIGLVSVAGVELSAGDQIEFKNYTGAVSAVADTANDKINILEIE